MTTEAGQDGAIGSVEGKLDQIIKDMDRARDDRKQQYEKQEKTDRTLDEVMRKLQSVDNRLENVEEPVADFNRWRRRNNARVGRRSIPWWFAGYVWKEDWAAIVG